MTDVATHHGIPREEILRARWRFGALMAVLAVVGLSLVSVLALSARDVGDSLDTLGVATGAAVVAGGALLIVAMVPAGLIAGAAGYVVGTLSGTLTAVAAATLGAVGCSAIARQVSTPAARHAFGGRIASLVEWLDRRPRRAVVMARLLPGVPFNASSYAFGLTAIGLKDVAAGTAVGFAPRCFAYAALGGSLRDLNSPEAKVALGASVVLAIVVTVGPRLFMGRLESRTRAE